MLLTEEVLKMVIAIVGLVLLSYFLVSFFYSDTKIKKQKEAVSTLDKISELLSNVTTSGAEVIALQPQRWTLFSFVGKEKKPNSCSGQNCMCICNKVPVDMFNRQIKQCTKNGACLTIENLEKFDNIKIESYKKATTSINVQEVGGKIQITKK